MAQVMGEKPPRAVFIPPPAFFTAHKISDWKPPWSSTCPRFFYAPKRVDERRVNPLNNDLIPYDWECRME